MILLLDRIEQYLKEKFVMLAWYFEVLWVLQGTYQRHQLAHYCKKLVFQEGPAQACFSHFICGCHHVCLIRYFSICRCCKICSSSGRSKEASSKVLLLIVRKCFLKIRKSGLP